MASKEEIRKYEKALARNNRLKTAHKVMNILTGVLALVWTVGMSAGVLYQTFTWLLNWLRTSGPGGYSFKTVYIVFIDMAICLYCLASIILGIITAIHAHDGIDYSANIAWGVFCIIFAYILPGVMYLVTRGLDNLIDSTIRDPVVVENEQKRAAAEAEARRRATEKRRRDPRRVFTLDEDEKGAVVDVNMINSSDLDEYIAEEIDLDD